MRRIGWILLALAHVLALAGGLEARAAALPFEDRVEAHRAVERALWERRIWPESNPAPKPALEEVLPESVLRARVEEVLRKSRALEDLWKRPIGNAELQAELDRMARSSQDPATLEAMFDALGRDPVLIAEAIARPALVDRLLRGWYAGDPDAEPVPFEAWWTDERGKHPPSPTTSTVERTELVLPDLGSSPLAPTCTDDTWTRTGTGAPSNRYGASAVWTGTEMVVWGGAEGGGRYNPATDTWLPVSTILAPVDSFMPALVWNGSVVLAWGGGGRRGGRYDPATDSWTPMTTVGEPSFVPNNQAVWTGTRLLVWEATGYIGYPVQGALYDPAGDTWTPMTQTGAPVIVDVGVQAVWTGSRLFMWPGKLYNPATDTWSPYSSVGEPLHRLGDTIVWTGSRAIIWGGSEVSSPDLSNSGAIYDPVADTWSTMTTVGAPSPRDRHAAAWVGNRMVIWGGNDRVATPYTNTGGRYDPATDSWAPMSLTNAPTGRAYESVTVAGNRMIVWGGVGPYPTIFNSGGVYDPAADTWVPTRVGEPSPTARSGHIAVWTGAELVLWGGSGDHGFRGDGAVYNPATDTWLPTSATDAPSARSGHTAVWSGTSVLVWGGVDDTGYPIRGGQYNPAGDSWSEITYWAAPYRTDHSAVWTGTRMVVWGGTDASGTVGTGALYDPAANWWTPMSAVGAPSPRASHSAVWTGSRMVVWGGAGAGGYQATGGRYDPAADAWTPTSTTNAPTARQSHTAVWSGTRMLVWGGYGGGALDTGGSYDPIGDGWSALPTAGAPAARLGASAIWTGTEMIVWGGGNGTSYLDTGGRYLPDQNSWRATTLAAAPRARGFHSGTWTGANMIVWGGVANGGTWNDGSRYCACVTWYPDADGDGYGGGPGTTVCDGSHPAATIARGGDCDDANPAIHPNRPDDNCDLVDDDCDGDYNEDYLPQPSVCGLGVCRSFGSLECIGVSLYNTCVPGIPNSADDATCNGLDDDCDGTVDDDFPHYEDHWVAISNAPSARTNATAVSSGTELLVFGGDNGSGVVQTGGIAYNFATDGWRTLPAGPTKRWHHTAVWADTRMIVWGGDDGVTTLYNTGSRYDPSTDGWTATTTTNAPTARGGHVAVWTGSRMVIWGGRDVTTYPNTGSRYDPAGNTWSATSTTGAPAGRALATAVWTGTEMIVWGGTAAAGTGLNSGGRYNPTTNAWTAVTTTGAPSGRYGHVALWTGSEMIVWGGTTDGNTYLLDGARYNPSTNTWTPIANLGAPSRRAWASAVVYGGEMWIWGGTYRTNEDPITALATGARYQISSNTWVPMNPYFPPAARARASAVLHGNEMIVWGGDPNGGALATGARYVPQAPCGTGSCARVGSLVCAGGNLSFQCTPGMPQPEVCDGADNDCNGTSDDNVPVPTGVPLMYAAKLIDQTIVLTWSATPNTSFYDMTRGSLNALRSSSGDFTSATCLQNDNPLTQGWDPAIPAAGDGTWYLSRAANACSGAGSWDVGSPAQQGSRDAELAASALVCP